MESEDEGLNFDFFSEFQSVPVEFTPKRRTCDDCRRPISVCWCPFLPKERIQIESTVIVLQHPSEERQCLKTAPILSASIANNKCRIIRGRRFSPAKNNFEISSNDTILLYPGPKAVDIDELPPVVQNGRPYTIILIDGTWAQARSLYNNSPALAKIRQVRLNPASRSEYVIKTQPTEGCLSTVESAALALCILEANYKIRESLLRPLHALCDFQLQHGAVEHRSKEFHIEKSGQSKPQRVKRRLAGNITFNKNKLGQR